MKINKLQHILRCLWVLVVLLACSIYSQAGTITTQQLFDGPFTNGQIMQFEEPDRTQPGFFYLSAKGSVTLRVKDNVKCDYAFSYTLNLNITTYNKDNEQLGSYNVPLIVTYSQGHTTYKGLDSWEMDNVYRIVTQVSSSQVNSGQAPPNGMIQLGIHFAVNRRETTFASSGLLNTTFSSLTPKKTYNMGWEPVTGAEEYDVEWTTIDNGAVYYTKLENLRNNKNAYVDTAIAIYLDETFRNNATRITTEDNSCEIPALSTDQLLLVRIRAVRYKNAGIREWGEWDYKQKTSLNYNIFSLSWNEPGLNWQYSATYAEEGKKKEIINYFDGSLRGRQTLTINNSDNVTVAQENIYDEFGRVAASILPAPISQPVPVINYIPGLNKNISGTTYSAADLSASIGDNCEIAPAALSTSAGAARYYSSANTFLTTSALPYNKYIPDANGKPFSVTQFTPDNTGRIKLQGGMGATFQPGTIGAASKTTKYYYGKPDQAELDALFGNDVGTADHYTKNMVVDPNGQISLSYLNASGKTIATALAGDKPEMVDKIPSFKEKDPLSPVNLHLITPEQFKFDESTLKLTARVTYLAPLKDNTATLTYSIQKLVAQYTGIAGFTFCNDCYYTMTAKVINECGETVGQNQSLVTIGSETACTNTGIATGSINVDIKEPGEYQVTVDFAYSPSLIETHTDKFITDGKTQGAIQSQFQYIKQKYIDGINASGCYSDCRTCLVTLGSEATFVTSVKSKLIELGLDITGNNESQIATWAAALHLQLKTTCDNLRQNCSYSPCEGVRQVMLADVSPGGQYALFKDNGTPLEEYNIIANNYTEVFSKNTFTDDDKVTLPDGTVLNPANGGMTLAQIVKYWKPSWATYFLKYHPEECKLRFCDDVSAYKNWDLRLQNEITKAAFVPSIATGISWSHLNPEQWLLDKDTFFNSPAGEAYKAAMLVDLQRYSFLTLQTAATTQAPERGLIASVDFLVYCSDGSGNINTQAPTTTPWINCTINDNCRQPDREWTTYLNAYLQLKEKYYLQKSENAPYCKTTTCKVGTPVTYTAVNPQVCAKASDFTIEQRSTIITANQQELVVVRPAGPVSTAVAVGIYYPDPADNTGSALPHQVQFLAGEQAKTFLIRDDIRPEQVLIRGIRCGVGAVYGADGIVPGSYVEVQDEDSSSEPLYCNNATIMVTKRRTRITLKDANGDLLKAGPNGVTVNFTYSINSWVTPGAPLSIREPATIIAGQSEGYTKERVGSTSGFCYDGPDTYDLSCYESFSGVESIAGGLYHCPDNNGPIPPPACSPILAYKKSRFQTTSGAIIQGTINVGELQAQADADIAVVRGDIAEGIAQGWMIALNDGLNENGIGENDSRRALLLERLKAITLATIDDNNPAGANNKTGLSPFDSYGAAMKATVLNGGNYTMGINPWLLSSPGPYGVKKQVTFTTISKSTTQLCSLIAGLKTSAGGQPLYNYLLNTYGNAMTLNQEEVAALENSCNACKFVLGSDITLPAFMDVNNPGSKSKAEYDAAKAKLTTDFGPNLVTTDDSQYSTILTNFLNQEFGFMLSYNAYSDYEGVATGPNPPRLANQPPYRNVKPLPFSCLSALLEQAVASGKVAYDEYIADLRTKFRNNYIAKCKLARPFVDFSTQQPTYHYTLYYYDQADNLVRTVPPEGVHPLEGSMLAQISSARQSTGSSSSCTYTGNPIISKPQAQQALGTALQSTTAVAIEAWLYNSGGQVDQITQVSADKKWLYQFIVSDGRVGVDVYPLTEGTGQSSVTLNSNSSHYQYIIPQTLLPLTPWVHTVVQSNTGIRGQSAPSVYLNGVILSSTTTNVPIANSGFRIEATVNGLVYPDNMPTLKHWRFYNRVLDASEIQANAQNTCLMPQGTVLSWFRFNVPPAGGPTTISPTSTIETTLQEVYPDHTLKTNYAYNSTNQVIRQSSPDGGESNFWYDLKSRLIASKNAKQGAGKYSYTKYDDLGRITEVGEKANASVLGTTTVNGNPQPNYLSDPTSFFDGGNNTEVTTTWYDKVMTGTPGIIAQNAGTLRKRVAASTYQATGGGPVVNATYYNYDAAGNVNTLWQQIDGLGIKRLDYEFDLVSGKVNFLRYQHGQNDQFYYKYKYDAENRLIEASSGIKAVVDNFTNTSTLLPEHSRLDASYQYYLHGPLARMELGDGSTKVQGVDYAYTLQGWLKGVNGQTLGNDMGADGATGGTIGKDAYAYSLGYYNGDYAQINGTPKFNIGYNATSNDAAGRYLYNGNISNSTLAISSVNSGAPIGFTYGYDQLNRIRTVLRHENFTSTWSDATKIAAHKETFKYDGNGNITDVTRNANGGVAADILLYDYEKTGTNIKNNRLRYVTDAVGGDHGGDLQSQGPGHYDYDAIGNIIKDGGTTFDWTVYGKLKSAVTPSVSTNYSYDAIGNRVNKAVTIGGTTNTTFYVRDAQGNPIAVYDNVGGTINWKEQQLYGSSRLGMWLPNTANINNSTSAIVNWQTWGQRQYELTNHLGNVISTITDKRLQVPDGGSTFHYEPDITNAQAYYAFGASMPGLTYTAPNGINSYRYSFNGKEDDTDIAAGGQDYGMRIYDKRVARFLSVDPITSHYPELTPYQFASNIPTWAVDIDGLEACGNPRAHWLGIQGHKCAPTPWRGFKRETKDILIVTAPLTFTIIGTASAPWVLRAVGLATIHPEIVTGVAGLTASLVDPNPNSDYPGSLDDLGKGAKVLIKGSFIEKFLIKGDKFNYVLGKLDKAIQSLSKKDIENVAKSNVRSKLLRTLGITDRGKVAGLIGNALKNGKFLTESITEHGRTFTNEIKVNGIRINVSFIDRPGEAISEFVTLTLPGAESNKALKEEIHRLTEAVKAAKKEKQ